MQATWPDLHSVDGLFAAPDGFLYGAAGIDNAVLRLDLRGNVRDVWAEPGMFRYPHGITVDSSGNLYTADTGDTWIVTGRLPEERRMAARSGPEGSAVRKLAVLTPA